MRGNSGSLRGWKQQGLANRCRSHTEDAAPDSAAARAGRGDFAQGVLWSLLVHVCLALAMVLLDPASGPRGGLREIPIEVVMEEPPPRVIPNSEEDSERSRTAMAVAGPGPVVHPAIQTPKTVWMPNSIPRPDPGTVTTRESRFKTEAEARGARQSQGAEQRQPPQSTAAQLLGARQEDARATAVPLSTSGGSEATSYQFVVGGMLERAKRYPETARRRGAKGIVTIGFVLDESGGVASVSLLRSSGEADLDSEGMALVSRAAPFPPPPGAKRSFAIEVAFGMGH